MRADFAEGIEGSGVKPGILKCAIDAAGLTEHVERVVRSVCRLHRETDAPVCIHTHAPSERGRDALRVLAEEDVDPERVMLAHCGDSTDVAYLEELAAVRGAARDGPLRPRHPPPLRGPRRDGGRPVRARASRARWSSRRTRTASATGSRRAWRRRSRRTGTSSTSCRTSSRSCARAGRPGPGRPHAAREPAHVLRAPRLARERRSSPTSAAAHPRSEAQVRGAVEVEHRRRSPARPRARRGTRPPRRPRRAWRPGPAGSPRGGRRRPGPASAAAAMSVSVKPGATAVTAMPSGAERPGQRLAERDQPGLARAVGGLRRARRGRRRARRR